MGRDFVFFFRIRIIFYFSRRFRFWVRGRYLGDIFLKGIGCVKEVRKRF